MYGQPWCRDGIRVEDLSLQYAPKSGVDAWGREKQQPVLLSVSLSFHRGFDSAASQDALDESTMHYGILSKNLRSLKPVQSWETLDELAHRIHQAILDTPPGASLIQSCQIEIKLPKASLLGDCANYVYFVEGEEHIGRVLHLSRIFIPTLIGVNDNERTAKQKLFVSVWIDRIQADDSQSYPELERIITQAIEPTEFETLESLAIYVLKVLKMNYTPLQSHETSVRLRLEKPQAVPHASAPIIEIVRTSDELAAMIR
ncbi:hypothetical protein E4T42_07063 [Aureobasidium subglaciale]|uniref:dihydroneopterin aldolase n=1 Tax=Aureobasidium subglaciale (strain EXF-2481) TaxID=1043005 RepID=A0A074YIR3_AURSE|nr:uncharacterized protein AUEXF2481DRAFT_2599 [Aureobasidium subglaciale EXF-2481]KAI5193537.1 hypothetical protein E4T38_09912 [Aureobasidium subglaciale]KAI5214351.1 hypothetical protein E4T41_09925 [Aureobasidium subglaciale]KAI5215411.1 hypothetical protein E4T40_08443 [Aureobasidium subglaciale]KAI5244622.1 hypothetical protein E4T42_07063 [Aureobasidium subglaciale]KAI5252487.1 hypothetical protein E4T46_09912 [Aureobasidium subglaciale]